MRARVGRFAKPRRFRSERRARAPPPAESRRVPAVHLPTARDARRRARRPRPSPRRVRRAIPRRRPSRPTPNATRGLGGGVFQRAGVRSPPVGRSHDEFAVRIVHARAVHPRSELRERRARCRVGEASKERRAAGSKPPDDNADASRVKKTTPSGDGSDPFESARAKRDDSVASCARRRRVCARTSRSVTPPRRGALRLRAVVGVGVRVRRRVVPPPGRLRLVASLLVEARVRTRRRAAARSAARRRATALGSASQSRVVRPENRARVAAAAACVARLADSRTRRLEDSPNRTPGTPEPSTDSESRAVPRERVERGAPLRRRRQRRERRRHRARARGWKTKRRTLAIPAASVRIADVAARSPASARAPPRRVPPPSPSPGPRRRKRDARRPEDARRTRGRTRANRGS